MNTYELNEKHERERAELYRKGTPYICRMAPSKTGIQIELLDNLRSQANITAYYRQRRKKKYNSCRITSNPFTIMGLEAHKEYEIYVENAEGRSGTRLFRTSEAPNGAIVVNYLHPDDKQYIFSGRYLCSPHMLRLAGGRLLASGDVFSSDDRPELTLIYYSDDNGKNWRYLTEIYPLNWAYLFAYRGALYAFGCTAEIACDVVIYRSEDGGATWSKPTILIQKDHFPQSYGYACKGAMEHINYNSKYYFTLEYGSWQVKYHYPVVLTFADGSDPMQAKNWTISAPFLYNKEEYKINGYYPDFVEGNLLVMPDGSLQEIRRTAPGVISRFAVNAQNPTATPNFIAYEKAPVSNSLFRIFVRNGYYYMVTNRESQKRVKYAILNGRNIWDKVDRFKRAVMRRRFSFNRNILSVFRSKDTHTWEFLLDIINRENTCPKDEGYQYPAVISEDKLYVLVRSAFNLADSQHNSNYLLFFTIDI